MTDLSIGGGSTRTGTSNENPSLQITTIKFDGNNYLPWACSALLAIQSRGLSDYLTEEAGEPKLGNPSYSRWISENSPVMSWLLHSMQPEISRSLLLINTAYNIWTAAKQTYSRVSNDAQIYELRKKVHETKQKGMIVSAYHSELQSLVA